MTPNEVIGMCINPVYLKSKGIFVQCGQCIDCRMLKSKEWAMRICLEALQHKENCVLTLTYNEDNLGDNNLNVRDLQLFLKRLRKLVGKLRYFACGEYGSKKGRKHFHIIIFGWQPTDTYFFCKDKKGTKLFRSPTIEKLWKKGFSSVGEVSYDTALYSAKYLQKSQVDRKKAFITMSKKPGIGFDSIKSDWLLSDKMYTMGKYMRLPRYFLDTLEKNGYSEEVQELKNKRLNSVISIKEFDKISNNSLIVAEREKKLEKIFGKGVDFLKF